MIYFTEHQKEKFLLRKNLRELRKDKGLISAKDATEVSYSHLLIQYTPLVMKFISSLKNCKLPPNGYQGKTITSLKSTDMSSQTHQL